MAGQSLISGQLAPYAGASLVIRFVSQGGGVPAVRSNSCVLDANGNFKIEGWDNSSATYAPSLTEFTFRLGQGTLATYYSVNVRVAGSTFNASTAVAGAPTPPSAVLPLTSGAPTTTPALGSMAFDPTANKLWIYGSSGWVGVTLS